MKNLKPSQLPVDTVIAKKAWGKYKGLYIKSEGGYWEDLFSGCGCCTDSERISDEGCELDEDDLYDSQYSLTTKKTSDEYFEDYKVISVPPGFVFVGDTESLHGNYSYKTMTYADGTSIHDCPGYNCEA